MTKVLWISNILFPEALSLLSGSNEQRGSGGWLLASSQMLLSMEEYDLCVVTASPKVSEMKKIQGERILYYIMPVCKSLRRYEHYMSQIAVEYSPDIVHIHGTELPYALAYINACGSKNVVVSIQGVISEIAKYYYGGISKAEILRSITLRDLIRGSIFSEKRLFEERGKMERKVLCAVKHVIGRTAFDKSHALEMNPQVNYHFCNETLRPDFYDGKWNYETCEKHSIFISQTRYPVKGAHVLLKAIPILLRKFPDIQVYSAGNNIIKGNLRISGTGYGLYLKKLIKELGLEKNIHFLGALTAQEMKAAMLKANVFVCPSSIENSSNSLGEAQLLGVPSVASYVGGIPDFIPNKYMGTLYRFEDYAMLAASIEAVFEQKEFDNTLMMKAARKRHDAEENIQQTIAIYNTVQNTKTNE